MGDKIQAKRIAKKFGLPVIEGLRGVKSLMKLNQFVKVLIPCLIKAAGGGGGKRYEDCK